MGVGGRDGVNCVGLESEESGLVLFAEMSSPGGSEVWGMVGSVGHDEGYAALTKNVKTLTK